MADNSMNACVQPRVLMKFLVNEGITPTEAYRTLQIQYGEETLSCSKAFEWCNIFKYYRISITGDSGRGESQLMVVILDKIQRVVHPMLDNRDITYREIPINGDRYTAMITNFFIPQLNNPDVQELWFQQDGAACHTARATIDLSKDTFGEPLISRFGPIELASKIL
ncbi:transposase [Trichonephila clavipes]|nr:transposase [Trichonephila clavipes]